MLQNNQIKSKKKTENLNKLQLLSLCRHRLLLRELSLVKKRRYVATAREQNV